MMPGTEKTKTMDTVCDVVADVFAISRDEVGPTTVQADIPEWDSLGHLNLVLALEEAFSVSFSVDEMPDLVSVEAIVEKIHR